ncbi:MAG: UDP-N-acetylmuramoyl-L-alanyl-D-glutamate--2,6-diaminopimelate ligase [bacterium]
MTLKENIKKFIPPFVLSVYHYKLALLGAFLYGFPGKNKGLKIIGVTGTSGKSTTVNFITRILEEADNKVAFISSIIFKVGDKEWENKYKMTMPGRFVIQGFLRRARNAGCKYVVLEVTSEGIKQFRHKFINFDTVVFTNLGQEHIESHGGFGNYRNAKLKLFKENQNTHVINADDENAKYFLDVPANKKISFSIKNEKAKKIKLNLIGAFNIMNALAAVCATENYGVDFETCKRALLKVKAIPGRMEVVQTEPFIVVVDYAHTPEQLESVYRSLTTNHSLQTTNLVCVLGSCGGGRDKWKRPVLGEIAKKYCKEIIITNEDPYDEDPIKIIEEVAEGAGKKAKKILDRKEAIKNAIELAEPGGVVIITGKGSEPWMCVKNGKKIPWDDRQTAKEALKGP